MSWYRFAVWGDAGGREQDWGRRHGGCCQVADPALRRGHRVWPVRNACGGGCCGAGHRRDFPAERGGNEQSVPRASRETSAGARPITRGTESEVHGQSPRFPPSSPAEPCRGSLNTGREHPVRRTRRRPPAPHRLLPSTALAPGFPPPTFLAPTASLHGRPRPHSTCNTQTPTSAQPVVSGHHHILRKSVLPVQTRLVLRRLTLPVPRLGGTHGSFHV